MIRLKEDDFLGLCFAAEAWGGIGGGTVALRDDTPFCAHGLMNWLKRGNARTKSEGCSLFARDQELELAGLDAQTADSVTTDVARIQSKTFFRRLDKKYGLEIVS